MSSELTMPFGKYKGKPVDVLAKDKGYLEWVLEQDWFKPKHPELYEVLVEFTGSENALELEENFLLSIALKKEKIESFEVYPFSLPAVKNLQRTLLHPNVTFLVGENGSGKSTLLEALAISQDFNPEGGTINFNFSTRSSHSALHEYLRVAKSSKKPSTGFFLRAESFFNVATEIEKLDEEGSGAKIIRSYGDKSLHEQSHGEAFFSLMKNRFGSYGLYLLDEPEAALSPNRQMSMITLMHDLVMKGSQFVIATHSPILLAYPHAKIYEIQDEGLTSVSYEESQTFRDSKRFLDSYEKMLEILIAD